MNWNIEHDIKYRYQGNTFYAKVLLYDRPDGEAFIKYHDKEVYWEARSHLVYSSFLMLRNFLEPQGKQLLCKGCALNVRPSGNLMISTGAYQMDIGKRVGFEDIVDLFDPEEDISKIASIEEQKVYFKKWMESIKNVAY